MAWQRYRKPEFCKCPEVVDLDLEGRVGADFSREKIELKVVDLYLEGRVGADFCR